SPAGEGGRAVAGEGKALLRFRPCFGASAASRRAPSIHRRDPTTSPTSCEGNEVHCNHALQIRRRNSRVEGGPTESQW
ncbi:hypothetical protein TIFTF001_056845, partial [Ficus carica]